MAETTRKPDDELLDGLSGAFVDLSAVPDAARVEAFLAHVRRVETPAPAVLDPVPVIDHPRRLRRASWAAFPAAAAAVVLIVLTQVGLGSSQPTSLTRVDDAAATLRSDLRSHASDTSTARALDALYQRIRQVPPPLRPRVPPSAATTLRQACQAVYGTSGASTAAPGHPPACGPLPAGTAAAAQPPSGGTAAGSGTAPPPGPPRTGPGSAPPPRRPPPAGAGSAGAGSAGPPPARPSSGGTGSGAQGG